MNDVELLTSLEKAFESERKVGHSILLYLKEVKLRHLYAKRGYPSLFSMLVKHFHQSESAANQRLKALDLMMVVPGVEERLVTGELSLSAAAMAQRQILMEEKLGGMITPSQKQEIVQSISGKTLAQTEIELFRHLPKTASAPKNFEKRVSADAVRLSVTLPEEVYRMLARLKELWGDADDVEILKRAFKLALKSDPAQRNKTHSATESAKHRGGQRLTYYGRNFDRELWLRAGSRCEFVDVQTGRRCECTFGLQREHKTPLGKGGTNELSNMELLCAAHNLLRAREEFGDKKIDQAIRVRQAR